MEEAACKGAVVAHAVLLMRLKINRRAACLLDKSQVCAEFGQPSQTHADVYRQDAVHVGIVVGIKLVEKAEGNIPLHVVAFVCALGEQERDTKLIRIHHCSF